MSNYSVKIYRKGTVKIEMKDQVKGLDIKKPKDMNRY